MCGMHVRMINVTQHLHFSGERAQQSAYTGCVLWAILPNIPIQKISTESTIFPSPHASHSVF